jgi:citrate synthase
MPDLGLEIDGTILGRSRLSAVDGPSGYLSYCGYDFHELAEHASWEEVLYLLWHDQLPSARQLADLREHMAQARCLDGDEMAFLRSLPTDGHGMDTLRTVISALPEVHPVSLMHTDTVFEEGMRLAAKLPSIVTTLIHLRNGEQPIPPDPKLDHAANFLWMLNGIKPDEVAVRAMNTYMVVVAENGLNVSTFLAAVVASTQNDLYAAITAALAGLKGLAHGGANEYAMRTFLAMSTPENVDAHLEAMLSRKERLMASATASSRSKTRVCAICASNRKHWTRGPAPPTAPTPPPSVWPTCCIPTPTTASASCTQMSSSTARRCSISSASRSTSLPPRSPVAASPAGSPMRTNN